MSLYKRGETWWVFVTSPNGERIRRSAGTQDKQAAQEYHDYLKVELWRVHKLGEKPRRTWQEAVVQWLREKDHKANIGGDKAKLKWLDPFLRGRYLDEINRELVSQIGEVKKAESSRSTANRYLALIRAILRIARDEWEWLDHIPKVKMYPEPKKRVRWITREEADRLIDELPKHLADLASFTLATGLRQRNASFLRWDQLDMERGTAWIHADESKSGRAIVVPLNNDALNVLHRVKGTHPVYVFTYQGKPVARTTHSGWWRLRMTIRASRTTSTRGRSSSGKASGWRSPGRRPPFRAPEKNAARCQIDGLAGSVRSAADMPKPSAFARYKIPIASLPR